jgi:hypothetical protein
LFALLAPAVALLLGLALERPSGQATPFDAAVYPALAGLLLLLDLLLYLRVIPFERAFLVTLSSAALFFWASSSTSFIFCPLPPTFLES